VQTVSTDIGKWHFYSYTGENQRRIPIRIPTVDLRELKALEIAARSRIVFENGSYLVPSQSSAKKYRVTLHPEVGCTCEDFEIRRLPCKHVMATRLACERDGGAKGPEIVADNIPKRPTYAQNNWSAYNKAQREEKHRFKALLADLCSGMIEPQRTGETRGRKRVPLADRLFSVCYKVYSTLSSRRFGSDLADAATDGYLSRKLNPNKVNIFLELEELTPRLQMLLKRSSLPLRAVETTFAPDSSGFSVSKFIRWFDEKYGRERSGKDWVKVHLICGVQTGIITAASIYGRDTNDCPILPELVNATAENFTVKEVVADKGYLSASNVDTIANVGGQAFIAPKISTTGEVGGLFEKMFHYYQYRREEFLKHYHQRSNVESVFSAVKRKFGDNVRSRTKAAMVNEVLAKLICYNLTRIILSQCELGIEAEFWKDEPVAAAKEESTLKFPGVA
jgi:transposase